MKNGRRLKSTYWSFDLVLNLYSEEMYEDFLVGLLFITLDFLCFILHLWDVGNIKQTWNLTHILIKQTF